MKTNTVSIKELKQIIISEIQASGVFTKGIAKPVTQYSKDRTNDIRIKKLGTKQEKGDAQDLQRFQNLKAKASKAPLTDPKEIDDYDKLSYKFRNIEILEDLKTNMQILSTYAEKKHQNDKSEDYSLSKDFNEKFNISQHHYQNIKGRLSVGTKDPAAAIDAKNLIEFVKTLLQNEKGLEQKKAREYDPVANMKNIGSNISNKYEQDLANELRKLDKDYIVGRDCDMEKIQADAENVVSSMRSEEYIDDEEIEKFKSDLIKQLKDQCDKTHKEETAGGEVGEKMSSRLWRVMNIPMGDLFTKALQKESMEKTVKLSALLFSTNRHI